jgi:hypothetical protein
LRALFAFRLAQRPLLGSPNDVSPFLPRNQNLYLCQRSKNLFRRRRLFKSLLLSLRNIAMSAALIAVEDLDVDAEVVRRVLQKNPKRFLRKKRRLKSLLFFLGNPPSSLRSPASRQRQRSYPRLRR